MLTFQEIQKYIVKRYNLNAAMAAATTKMLIADIVAAGLWPKLYDIKDVEEYCDFTEDLASAEAENETVII